MKKMFLTLLVSVIAMAANAFAPVTVSVTDGDKEYPCTAGAVPEMTALNEIILGFETAAQKPNTSGIKVYKSSVGGTVLATNLYSRTSGNKAIIYNLDEYDEFTEPIRLEAGVDYYVVIPEGAIAGMDEVVVHVKGKQAPLKIYSTNPYNKSVLEQFTSIEFTLSEAATTISGTPKMTKGAQDGEQVAVNWGSYGKGSTKVSFFSNDEYDEFVEPIALEGGVDYYITVPAGMFKAASGAKNDEYVVILKGKEKELVPVSVSPANNSLQETFGLITLNFNEAVSLVAGKMPKFTKGAQTGSDLADSWNASKGSTSVSFWMEDYDGFTDIRDLEPNTDYYITIPAGAIKNAAGTLTKEIVVKITGKERVLSVVSTTLATGTEATQFHEFSVDFGTAAGSLSLVAGKKPKLCQGSANGTVLTADNEWAMNVKNGVLSVALLDEYAEVGETVNLTPGNDYYIVVPEGMVKNTRGALNKEVVIKLVCPATAIEEAGATANYRKINYSTGLSIDCITVEFKENAFVSKKATSAVLRDASNNVMDDAEDWLAFAASDSKCIDFKPIDMDGYTAEVYVRPDVTYTFAVPAGVVRNAAGGLNKAFTMTVSYDTTTGINVVVEGKGVAAKKAIVNGKLQIVVDGAVFNEAGARME